MVEACEVIEYPKNLLRVIDPDERISLVRNTLTSFLQRHPVHNQCVCVALPAPPRPLPHGQATPDAPQEDRRAVQFEARRTFPIPLNQLAWGAQTLRDADDDATGEAKQEIVLAAAKRLSVEEHLALFEELRIPVTFLQSDALALHNYFAHEGDLPGGSGEDTASASASSRRSGDR